MARPLTWNGVIRLDDLLTYVCPAYAGDTWDEALELLLSDPCEAETIGLLVAELDSGPGLFDEPVVVDPEDLRLCNGMHRVAATRLAGKDLILASDRSPELSDDEQVEIAMTLSAADWPRTGEDAVDFAGGWLRSFRLPSGRWVETAAVSGRGSSVNAAWSCRHAEADLLVETLASRCAAHGVTMGVDSVRRVHAYAEEDARS